VGLILLWRKLIKVDLGVDFDDKLSFKDYTTDKTNKAYGVLGIIKCNFDNLSTGCLCNAV